MVQSVVGRLGPGGGIFTPSTSGTQRTLDDSAKGSGPYSHASISLEFDYPVSMHIDSRLHTKYVERVAE